MLAVRLDCWWRTRLPERSHVVGGRTKANKSSREEIVDTNPVLERVAGRKSESSKLSYRATKSAGDYRMQ